MECGNRQTGTKFSGNNGIQGKHQSSNTPLHPHNTIPG